MWMILQREPNGSDDPVVRVAFGQLPQELVRLILLKPERGDPLIHLLRRDRSSVREFAHDLDEKAALARRIGQEAFLQLSRHLIESRILFIIHRVASPVPLLSLSCPSP